MVKENAFALGRSLKIPLNIAYCGDYPSEITKMKMHFLVVVTTYRFSQSR